MPKYTYQHLQTYISLCKIKIPALSDDQLAFAKTKIGIIRSLICAITFEQLQIPIKISGYICNLNQILDDNFQLIRVNNPFELQRRITLEDISLLGYDEINLMNWHINEIIEEWCARVAAPLHSFHRPQSAAAYAPGFSFPAVNIDSNHWQKISSHVDRLHENELDELETKAAQCLNIQKGDNNFFVILTTALLNLTADTKESSSIPPYDDEVSYNVRYTTKNGRLYISHLALTPAQLNNLKHFYATKFPPKPLRIPDSPRLSQSALTFNYRQFVDEILPRVSNHYLKRRLDTIAILKNLLREINQEELIGAAILKFCMNAGVIPSVHPSEFSALSRCHVMVRDQKVSITYRHITLQQLCTVAKFCRQFLGFDSENCVVLVTQSESANSNCITLPYDDVVSKIIPAFIKQNSNNSKQIDFVRQQSNGAIPLAPPGHRLIESVSPLIPPYAKPAARPYPLLPPASATPSSPPAPPLVNPGTNTNALFAAVPPSISNSASRAAKNETSPSASDGFCRIC